MPATFLRTPEDKMKFKGGKNNRRFAVRKANNGIIVLRAGRQIDVVNAQCEWTKFQTNDNYVGVELDFSPTLDEEFSITTSKQQIRLSDRLWDILEEAGVLDAITAMRASYESEAAVVRQKWEDSLRQGVENQKRPSEAASRTRHRRQQNSRVMPAQSRQIRTPSRRPGSSRPPVPQPGQVPAAASAALRHRQHRCPSGNEAAGYPWCPHRAHVRFFAGWVMTRDAAGPGPGAARSGP